jgi:glycosyltransferase involved in cell wall biosynthesis
MDECLQSVLSQTFSAWECIIVNDSSTDDTEKNAALWLKKDPRFKYIFQENSGLSAARNSGINIAAGEWILPLDCDDKIAPDYLELAERKTTENPSIIYCEGEFFESRSGRIPLKNYDFKSLLIKNLIFCTALFKKEDWKKIGGYDQNMRDGLEDWDFWISLLKINNNPVIKIPSVGFYYRIKEKSMLNDLLANEKKLAEIQTYVFRKHSTLYTEQFPNFITLLNENFDLKAEISVYRNSVAHRLVSKLKNFKKKWSKSR